MNWIKITLITAFCATLHIAGWAQKKALKPPMGFMTWNYFQLDISEDKLKSLADAMVEKGLVQLGYNYIFIDDGWQGGRDYKNNIIPNPQKFPSGMKYLADYLHHRGIKLGIYSDAAPLTCAGFTGSLHFEEQDAKTFAQWGVDYLKYDYCYAPEDLETAKKRYATMSKALNASGREIILAICEWGNRKPWLWAEKSGGSLWRTTADIRDKWKSKIAPKIAEDLHKTGAGILDIVNINATLDNFAHPGAWNDPDMLVVGLRGKKGPSGDLGGVGCTDIEYQSQMSLWCMMASPLMITCDVRNMDAITEKILTQKELIAINQDPLGIQAQRIFTDKNWQIFVKPLQNGKKAIAVLNQSEETLNFVPPAELGLRTKSNQLKEIWSQKSYSSKQFKNITVKAHETLVFLTH